MRGHPRISPIYRLGQADAPRDPEAIFARVWRWYRDLWVEQGTIVARPEDLPEHLRGPLVDWANEAYGERRQSRRAG